MLLVKMYMMEKGSINPKLWIQFSIENKILQCGEGVTFLTTPTFKNHGEC